MEASRSRRSRGDLAARFGRAGYHRRLTETSGPAARVDLAAFGLTDPGRVRKNNEDAFLVARLADAGEVASALVVQSLRDAMLHAEGNWSVATREAVERANRDVWSVAKAPGRKAMGATVTAVCVDAGTAYIAEVGDSRAYLIGLWFIGR